MESVLGSGSCIAPVCERDVLEPSMPRFAGARGGSDCEDEGHKL